MIMPSGGSYLLDTNIVIAMFKGDASTKKHLEQKENTLNPYRFKKVVKLILVRYNLITKAPVCGRC